MPDNIVVTTELREGGGGWVMGVLNKALQGSASRSNPLPFYTPFLEEKVPLSYILY